METCTSEERRSYSRLSALVLCCGLWITLLRPLSTAAATIPGENATPEEIKIEKGAFCDAASNTLYFVDYKPPRLRSYHPDTSTFYSSLIVNTTNDVNLTASFIIPIQDNPNYFVVGLCGTVAVIKWSGKSSEDVSPIYQIYMSEDDIYTGTTDSNGLLWIVITASPADMGALKYIDFKGFSEEMIAVLGLLDAITFSLHDNMVYYMDTPNKMLYSQRYDSTTKYFNSPKEMLRFNMSQFSGEPGGMTVDKNGNLWMTFNTNSFIKFNVNAGGVTETIAVNEKLNINSVAFCGQQLEDLYATITANDEKTTPVVRHNFNGQGVSGYAGVPAKFPIKDPFTYVDS